MRVLSLIAVAAALASSVSASKAAVFNTYTVSCQTTYIVQNGDTCSKIGKGFGINTSKIKKWNPSINPSCTNLYIDQILCLSNPTTEKNAVVVDSATTKPVSKTTAKTSGPAPTVLTLAGSQCTTDDDCSGIRCCNLANNQCVLDPNNTICDIPPPKTTVSPPTTTTTPSGSCYPGSKGLGNGDGYSGYCCSTQADCQDDCISGKCNGPVNTKTSAVPTTTTTTKAGTTTTPSTGACYPGSKGLGNGDGYSGYCCSTQADCQDDCISGKCNGPVNTKTTALPTGTATKTTATKTIATTTATAVPTGLTVQLSSSKDFCLMLPSSPGNMANNGGKVDTDAIADSEKNAVAFCYTPNINAPGAGVFPSGFITSAKYQTNSAAGFVQVRGTINPAAYSLSSQDQGGQYDNHGAGSPPKSTCAGYKYYVSLVEPNSGDFCIRCCSTYSDCNAGRSAYGCDRVVPEL